VATAALRRRLQLVLLRDPGYISLSVRWLGWLIGLGTVLLGASPPENLQGAPAALALSGGQLLFLSLHPGWLRFEPGRDLWSFAALLRPAADLLIALGCLYLTGGWNSPMYHFAVTVVLAPSLRYGILGALAAASSFTLGFMATVRATPLGFAPAYLGDGSPGPDLLSTPANPLMIGLFAAFLGEVLQRLQFERSRAEALAAAQERARMAADIHDGVAQTLFMLTMSLESGLVMAQKEGAEKTSRHLESLAPISRKALLELRNAMHNLEPLAAGEQSLAQAVGQLVRDYQSAMTCRLSCRVEEGFEAPGERSSALFRMLQEALTNACHHAQASTIEVRLGSPSPRAVTVRDDGKGFDPERVCRGRGLDNLKSRAEDAGMSFEIGSNPEGGTFVQIGW
jgi:signal transduction histidine kinase